MMQSRKLPTFLLPVVFANYTTRCKADSVVMFITASSVESAAADFVPYQPSASRAAAPWKRSSAARLL